MAYNALYGYDTAAQGYGRANTPGRDRQYPAWMTDLGARGIGEAQDYTPTVPGVIDIPRYYAPPDAPAAQQQMTSPQSAGFASDARQGGDGGFGGANDQVGNQPAPGYLADILSGIGLSTGQYGGSAASGIDNQGKAGDIGATNQIGDFADAGGAGQDSGAKGDIGGGAGTGDPGTMNGLYRGGMVTYNRLSGPNPPGPDDGFAALDVGEGVMTAAAMKHYGPAFLARLNKLQVPKGARKA